MFLQQIPTGGDRNLAYLVADPTTRRAAVIDPSYAPERIADIADDAGLSVAYAFCTHDHHDHTNGNEAFARRTGVRPLLFGDIDPGTKLRVEDAATFSLGRLAVRILHTPGHTPDSICLHVGDAVFTGDTLFVGKVGGTDSTAAARAEYDALHRVLLSLPDDTRVFPGHDVGVAPASTIGRERRTNPFLLRPDFDRFVDLKRHWAAYKKEHGIT